MKPRLLPFIVICLAVLACTLPVKQTPTPTTPTPWDDGVIQPPAAAVQAQTDLAGVLGVPPDSITIRDIQSAQWGNSCMDAPVVGETCAQQPSNGYIVVLAYHTDIYTYHTDLEGIQLRRIDQVTDPSQAALEASSLLAGMLGYNPDSVRIVKEESLRFSDSCLGIPIPETICSQVQVRGTRIELEANGASFEFRSAEDPIKPVLARAAGIEAGKVIMLLSRDGGPNAYCDNLNVTLSGKVLQYTCFGAFAANPGITDLSIEDQSVVLRWILNFSPFDTTQTRLDGVKVRLTFNGIGEEIARFDDQKEIQTFVEGLLQVPGPPPTLLPTEPAGG
jgi:hypothetical protein